MSASVAEFGLGTDREGVSRALQLPVWIWPSFLWLDLLMASVVYPEASGSRFVVYRVVVLAAFWLVYRASKKNELPIAQLFRMQGSCYVAAAFAVSLMAIELGGLVSPYMHGLSLCALVWAALVPANWRRSAPTFGLIAASYPLTMLIASAWMPKIAADLTSPATLMQFASNYVFILSTCGLGLILSYRVWKAQNRARRMGSYELTELIGEGGMGEVWRASHNLLARDVAIKVIRSESLEGSAETRNTTIARFEREAQATASLKSPHTVELYDFGVSSSGALFSVMELLSGLDTEKLVKEQGSLPPARAIHVLRQVCESLAEAHDIGLVHRDIKPSNIFLCRYGRDYDFVKVLDFGLVKPETATGDARLTADNVVTGTPAFLSPEQVTHPDRVDHRSDIYSLGCLAYWLLTGSLVFEGESPVEVLAGHLHGEPTPLSRRTPSSLPDGLEELIATCLAKAPENRPQSIDQVAETLEKLSMDLEWTAEQARRCWLDIPSEGSSSSSDVGLAVAI